LEHLVFSKIEIDETMRRKRKFNGQYFEKDNEGHGIAINQSVKEIINSTKEIVRKFHFEPHLILKIELEDDAMISEAARDKLLAFGLQVIDEESKELMVLFAEDIEVPDFLKGLEDYKNGVIAKKNVVHSDLFNMIKSVRPWDSDDRIHGLNISDEKCYYDLYLWIFDTYQENINKVNEFKMDIDGLDVRICDQYVSNSVVLIRIQSNKDKLDLIKENPLIYQIQNIPEYSIARNAHIEEKESEINDITFDNSHLDPETSSSICVIDSGVFKGHPLFEGVVGDSKVFYGETGIDDNDNNGHGTLVASICAYGEISKDRTYEPDIYILNAKVHNGVYESEYNLCIAELQSSGLNPSFEQQQLIGDIYDHLVDVEEILTSTLFENFDRKQKRFIQVIVTRYLGIYDKLIPNQMKEIVEYFYNTYGCRIYNLSQGDLKQVFGGGKPNAWSCVLDELQHKYDVLFVVSSGNYFPEGIQVEEVHSKYPLYLLSTENSSVIEPANSALSLTIGSVSCSNEPVVYREESISPIAITRRNELSSSTRVGCGSNKAMKPDLLFYGGDGYIDNQIRPRLSYIPNRGMSVLGFNNNITGSVFRYDIGSSFSAPYISHLAAKLTNKYQDISMNAVRALLAYSANIPSEIKERFEDIFSSQSPNLLVDKFKMNYQGEMIFDKKRILAFTSGYGLPDKGRLLESEENRVIMYSDIKNDNEMLSPDTFHIYQLPVFEEFRNARGKKIIEIVVAFNPEVRKTRMDYIGTTMSFELIRGKSFEDVYDVYKNQSGRTDEEKRKLFDSKYRCTSKVHSKNIREKGTLQKMKFEFSTNADDYSDNYYVVINSHKKWSNKKVAYSMVVSLETQENIRIYEEIKRRVEVPIRERVRR
jgi:hypothetical protein